MRLAIIIACLTAGLGVIAYAYSRYGKFDIRYEINSSSGRVRKCVGLPGNITIQYKAMKGNVSIDRTDTSINSKWLLYSIESHYWFSRSVSVGSLGSKMNVEKVLLSLNKYRANNDIKRYKALIGHYNKSIDCFAITLIEMDLNSIDEED